MVISELQTSFDVDCLMSSHPIYAQVNHTDQIREIFDPISYAKGTALDGLGLTLAPPLSAAN